MASALPFVAPIVGAVAGGLASKSKDSGSTQTQTQTLDPRMQGLLYGNQTTERRLKAGVTPTYAQNNNGQDISSIFSPTQAVYGQPNSQGQLTNPESDYETVTTGAPGLYNNAQDIYDANIKQGYIGENKAQKDATKWTQNANKEVRANDPYTPIMNSGASVLSGGLDTQLSQGMTAARSGQGTLDPTTTMEGLLAGNVDTTGLDAIQQAAANRANIGYQDNVIDAGRMFSEQIAPNIRGEAVASGQYGGSRQGIAEGLAARGLGDQLTRNARDLSLANMDMGQELYGAAYQDAKDKSYTTATGLNTQALQAQETANRQSMDANTQALNNRIGGANLTNQGYSGLMQMGNDAYSLASRAQADAQAKQQYPWTQISNLSGILQPGATLGSTTTGTVTQQNQTNPLTTAIGGGLLGLQAYNSWQPSQPQMSTYNGALPGNSYGVMRP